MTSQERDAYLDSVLLGGREFVTVVVQDYDQEWPTVYASVRGRVMAALGARAVDVQHIGSTSVPGLAAKPVVDVLLTVKDVSDEPAYVPALEGAGFLLRVREPGHRMFRTHRKDVHLHVYEPDDQAVTDYLDLRDWLRVDSEDRERYAELKRNLSQRSWSDMNHYADAKSDVIQQVLTRARAWRLMGAVRRSASLRTAWHH
ncbi:MAG: uncharacterized protein JWN35_2965 [Frankiales bacterium]|jgi:GrpB-like predicted nucleotidyltransferase (UPF0157 family)|nr:uncharacterized protein [Frankiales bacterium]